jgi:hypothetical protein
VVVTLGRLPGTSRYHLNPDGKRLDMTHDNGRAVVLSNLPLDELSELTNGKCPSGDCLVIYGGFGGSLGIEVLASAGTPLGCGAEVPIEKIQVILLGIDGLRQDVLYPKNPQDGMAAESIGEPGTDYYLDPRTLPGIGQIFGLRLRDNGSLSGTPANYHYRFEDVVAVFPTVTLANWASLYTGAVPKETGLLGNEFFARDLIDAMEAGEIPLHPIPGMRAPGVVSFLGGAFDRNTLEIARVGGFRASGRFGNWAGTPQNRILRSSTLFEQLRPILAESPEFAAGEAFMIGDLQLYARDLDPPESEEPNRWLVANLGEGIDAGRQHFGLFAVAEDRFLDQWPVDFAIEHFGEQGASFPAFLAMHFLFLDHQGHEQGHGEDGGQYKGFFRARTDVELERFVQWLKDNDQFHNKLFVITTDHGQTQVQDPGAAPSGIDLTPCDPGKAAAQLEGNPNDQRTDRKRDDERILNRALTTWELGALFREFNRELAPDLLELKLLVQEDVLNLFDPFQPILEGPRQPVLCAGGTERCPVSKDIAEANVIAAMNGPMMHVYVKSGDVDQNDPTGGFKAHPAMTRNNQPSELALVAEVLRVALTEHVSTFLAISEEAQGRIKARIAAGMRNSADFILYRNPETSESRIFDGLTEEGRVLSRGIDDFLATRADLPFAAERIRFLNDPNRSGDLIVHFKTQLPINRYTSGSSCRGDHGSLNRMDSYVPLIVSYPGGNKEEFLKWWNERGEAAVCSVGDGESAGNLHCHGSWMTTDLIRELTREIHGPRPPPGG